MTTDEKNKPVTVEGMQAHTKTLFNKGIGSEGVCSTDAATAAKEVTLGTTFELVENATIIVKFSKGINVEGATLAVTHTDLEGKETKEEAKPIYYHGAALEAHKVKAGASVILRYNGTAFDIVGDLEARAGFIPEVDEETGYTTMTPQGGATIEPNEDTGYFDMEF